MHRASRIPLLSRKVTVDEHEAVLQLLTDLGIENGWVQEMGAAEKYLPDFEREGYPFSSALQGQEEPNICKGIRSALSEG